MKNTSILGQRVDSRTTFTDDKRTACLQDGRVITVANRGGARAKVFFVLGPPGSGKTTVAATLKARWERQGYKVISLNDYLLLFVMAAREHYLGKSLECPAQ